MEEITKSSVYTQMPAKWEELENRYLDYLSNRIIVERDWEERRCHPPCPADTIKQYGDAAWLSKGADSLKNEPAGQYWFLNLRKQHFYHQFAIAPRFELESDGGILKYMKNLKAVNVVQGKVTFPEQRDLDGLASFIVELYKKSTDNTPEWGKYFLEFVAKQNAISKSVRWYHDQEATSLRQASAMKELYNHVYLFTRNVTAVLEMLDEFHGGKSHVRETDTRDVLTLTSYHQGAAPIDN